MEKIEYTKETLTANSLTKFRILCKLPRGNFACFEILEPDNFLSDLKRADNTLRNEGINTDCVIIPIEFILTESFHKGFSLSGETEWAKYIKGYGLFTNASITFYNPSNIKIEL